MMFKATERDVSTMKEILTTQGQQPALILGQLYAACGVTFTEEQLKEIKACEKEGNDGHSN